MRKAHDGMSDGLVLGFKTHPFYYRYCNMNNTDTKTASNQEFLVMEENLAPVEPTATGAPKIIGAYEVLEAIGGGGMGLVYKVRHRGAGNILAMKVLRKELAADPVNVTRFRQELKTTSLLNHANVAAIYDSGVTEEGAPYLVMEYVDSCNLQQILEQEGYLDLERFFHIFGQVCDALSHAHAKRIVHRDIKPSNIVVSLTDSQFELVKLVDFGIARVFQRPASNSTTRLTQMSEVLGSPDYMSPEQCLNQKLDERSDIYSLGVVMYEALAGSLPYKGGNAVEVIMGHLQQTPPSIAKMRPDFNVPAELETLIFTCLEKEPLLRIQTFDELAAELKRISLSSKSRSVVRALRRYALAKVNWVMRSVRKLKKNRAKLVKPAAAILILGAASFFAYDRWMTGQYSVANYITQAQIALIHNDYTAVELSWNKALQMALQEKSTPFKLAVLYERAGDDLVSSIQKNSMLSSPMGWQAVDPGYNPASTGNAIQARLAKPYLQKAFDIYAAQRCIPEQQRVLDKLIAVAETLQDQTEEMTLLRKQLLLADGAGKTNFDDNRAGPIYQKLGELLTASGDYKGAETMLKKVVQLERRQNCQPYPNSLEQLALFYERSGQVDKVVEVRKEIIASVKGFCVENTAYRDQLKREMISYATALRMQGNTKEADAVLQEAEKIKGQ